MRAQQPVDVREETCVCGAKLRIEGRASDTPLTTLRFEVWRKEHICPARWKDSNQ